MEKNLSKKKQQIMSDLFIRPGLHVQSFLCDDIAILAHSQLPTRRRIMK